MRLAFAYFDWTAWTAGTTFFRSLFASLKQLNSSEKHEILLVIPHGQSPSYAALSEFIDGVIEAPEISCEISPEEVTSFRSRIFKAFHNRESKTPASGEHALGKLLRQYGVDVFISTTHYGADFAVPLIIWIPDFQHIYMPQMFSAHELSVRHKEYLNMAKYATLVMVTSLDVKNHFAEFAPDQAHKARLLNFRAQIPAAALLPSPEAVALKYNLPEKFIYLPNQFWKHKNHRLVIESLQIAKSKNPAVTVVCTGQLRDYRHPEFFQELLLEASQRNVRENFIILGLLPGHEEVFALMRKSLAVLQPSLFEGLGMGLAEAKALNKFVILSDIPIFRELGPANAVYFDPHNSQDLANKLLEYYENPPPLSEAKSSIKTPVSEESCEQDQAQASCLMAKSFLRMAREPADNVNVKVIAQAQLG